MSELKPVGYPLFKKIFDHVNVKDLLDDVLRQPELWNKNPCRLSRRGPHYETQDMILRYRDETKFRESGDWSKFCDEHVAEWNKTIDYLPRAKILAMDLFSFLRGEVLGGVFLYKLQPGAIIHKHKDWGWHPEFYEKFNICLQSNEKTAFYYDDDKMVQEAGDIHWFRNDVDHWVMNNGDTDHIVMTVCMRFDRGTRCPWSPEGYSRDRS